MEMEQVFSVAIGAAVLAGAVLVGRRGDTEMVLLWSMICVAVGLAHDNLVALLVRIASMVN